MSRTVFISGDARHLEEAGRVVQNLLSDSGQKAIGLTSALIPMTRGASIVKQAVGQSALDKEPSFVPIRLSAGLLT
jgi:two-component system sensor histidine kinase TctE